MEKDFPKIPTHPCTLLGKEELAFGLSYPHPKSFELFAFCPSSSCCISFPQWQEQATIFPSMPLLDVLDYSPHHSLPSQAPGSFLRTWAGAAVTDLPLPRPAVT